MLEIHRQICRLPIELQNKIYEYLEFIHGSYTVFDKYYRHMSHIIHYEPMQHCATTTLTIKPVEESIFFIRNEPEQKELKSIIVKSENDLNYSSSWQLIQRRRLKGRSVTF